MMKTPNECYYSSKAYIKLIDTISEDETFLKNKIKKNMREISKSTISLPFEVLIEKTNERKTSINNLSISSNDLKGKFSNLSKISIIDKTKLDGKRLVE
jgi:hypothetical protein